MIEVKVHKDVKSYKEKLFLGLTAKQLLIVTFAALIAGYVYYISSKSIPELADWLVLLILFTAIAPQFITIKTFSLYEYIRLLIRHQFSNNRKLYQTKERSHNVQKK